MRHSSTLFWACLLALGHTGCTETALFPNTASNRTAPVGPQEGPAKTTTAETSGEAENSLDLPFDETVTHLSFDRAAGLPLVNIPTARVAAMARKHCRTHWYGLYFGSRKVGYSRIGCALKGSGRREVLATTAVTVLDVRSYGAGERIEFSTVKRFATYGRGELLFMKSVKKSTKQTTTVSVQRRADGWHLEKTYNTPALSKPPERRVLPTVKADLTNGEAAFYTALLAGRLRPGAAYRILTFDRADGRDRPAGVQFLASSVRRLQGVKVSLHKVLFLDLHKKIRSTVMLDQDGLVVEGVLPGNIRIRREEKRTARHIDPKADDFGLGSIIRAEIKQDPVNVRYMRVRLSGFLPETLSRSRRHRIRKNGPSDATLTVTRESLDDLPRVSLPQPAERFPNALRATRDVESDHRVVRALARKAVGRERNALKAAIRINRFVFTHLRKDLSTNLDSALAVAMARRGDCTEHARLMVALCRSVGLPAREVRGLAYTRTPTVQGFGYHTWVEFWTGRWISADPTWGELPADATHLRMGSSGDMRWLGTLGSLRLKVVEVRAD